MLALGKATLQGQVEHASLLGTPAVLSVVYIEILECICPPAAVFCLLKVIE